MEASDGTEQYVCHGRGFLSSLRRNVTEIAKIGNVISVKTYFKIHYVDKIFS